MSVIMGTDKGDSLVRSSCGAIAREVANQNYPQMSKHHIMEHWNIKTTATTPILASNYEYGHPANTSNSSILQCLTSFSGNLPYNNSSEEVKQIIIDHIPWVKMIQLMMFYRIERVLNRTLALDQGDQSNEYNQGDQGTQGDEGDEGDQGVQGYQGDEVGQDDQGDEGEQGEVSTIILGLLES